MDAERWRLLQPSPPSAGWVGRPERFNGSLRSSPVGDAHGPGGGMMDLILWRHAEAEELADAGDDLARALTSRGEKQAARMAAWLDRQLPEGLRVLASPARRTEQTANALGRKFKMRAELLPGGTPQDLLDLVQWPRAKGTVLVVGHQPMLGQTIAQLMGLQASECAVRKGAVWWLRQRQRPVQSQNMLITVQSPEFLGDLLCRGDASVQLGLLARGFGRRFGGGRRTRRRGFRLGATCLDGRYCLYRAAQGGVRHGGQDLQARAQQLAFLHGLGESSRALLQGFYDCVFIFGNSETVAHQLGLLGLGIPGGGWRGLE